MSNRQTNKQRFLPSSPSLRQLKEQARDLFESGNAESITNAQFKIARQYGFASWPKLKAHVASLNLVGKLKQAINHNDFDVVKSMMTENPTLHEAPLGYKKNGPLTWVAECRIPSGPPAPIRLAIARWMIENGSNVHQGGDGPLMRAALRGERVPMMETLVEYGADVNAEWNGDYPILFAPCESVDPIALQWLLDHGAHPNCSKAGRVTTALDYLIGSYERSSQLGQCIDLLLAAGGNTRYDQPGILATLRDRADHLAEVLDQDPNIVRRCFPNLDCGSTGARRLLLKGATLLHVAAEYGSRKSVKLLIERGVSPNVQAWIDETGVGGQTPIFHAVTQFHDRGLEVTRLLLEAGADLKIRARLPGHYEREDEIVECTPLEYALQFPGLDLPGTNEATISLLRKSEFTA